MFAPIGTTTTATATNTRRAEDGIGSRARIISAPIGVGAGLHSLRLGGRMVEQGALRAGARSGPPRRRPWGPLAGVGSVPNPQGGIPVPAFGRGLGGHGAARERHPAESAAAGA